jgi:hypothetical protein
VLRVIRYRPPAGHLARSTSPMVPRVARRELGYAFEELVAGLLAVVAQR